MIENEALALSSYDPKDHYWIVESKPGEVYSSASRAYVPDSDATYQAWLERPGKRATKIVCEVLLNDVLLSQAPDRAIPRSFTKDEIAFAIHRVESAFDHENCTEQEMNDKAASIRFRVKKIANGGGRDKALAG